MTFDEYMDLTREFVQSNYASRTLIGLSLVFNEGQPMYLPMPDEKPADDDGELHPIEQAILDILASGETVRHKTLKSEVMKRTECAPTTFARYFRRLKVEKHIVQSGDGYRLRKRKDGEGE